MAAFFSCKANQRAIEDPDLKHGVFTHFLVEGLNGKADQPVLGRPGDGIITMSELTSYVANNTYAFVFEKYKGVKQSPDIKGEFDTNLPLATVTATPNAAGIEFVRIKAGSFQRGSENGSDDEQPVRTITITKPFYAGKHEVTIGQVLQWLNAPGVKIDGPWVTDGGADSPVKKEGSQWVLNTSSGFGASAEQPMRHISWDRAVAFCDWCSQQDAPFK